MLIQLLLFQNPAVQGPENGFIIFIVMTAAFVVFDVLAGPLTTGLWTGYLYANTLALWLVQGFIPAIGMIIAGSCAAALVRWFQLKSSSGDSMRLPLVLTPLHRFVTLGLALCVVQSIYLGAGGVIPITYLNPGQILALTLGEIAGAVVIQAIGLLVIAEVDRKRIQNRLFWSNQQRSRLFPEILLLIVAPVAALIAVVAGIFVFVVVMIVLCIQALRYKQIVGAQMLLFRRVEELAMLESVGHGIISNLDIDNLLMSVYKSIRELMPISVFVVALKNTDGHRFTYPTVIIDDQKRAYDAVGHLKGYLDNLIDYVNLHGSMKRYPLNVNGTSTQGELFALPILFGEKILGVLCIQSAPNTLLTDDDVRVLQAVTVQTGLALRNATLYNRSVRMAESLEQIHDFVHHSILNVDIEEVLAASSQVAVKLVDAQHGAVFLKEGLGKESVAPRELVAVYTDQASAAFQQMIMRWVGDLHRYADGTIKIIPNVADAASELLQPLAEQEGIVSLAEVPLRMQDVVIGVMGVYHAKSHFYTKTETYLLETLAFQLVAFIENAGLVKTLEGFASQQAQLVHLSRISSESLDARSIVLAIARSLSQMLRVKCVYIGILDPKGQYLRFIHENDDDNEALLIPLEELMPVYVHDTFRDFARIQPAENMPASVRHLIDLRGGKYAATAPLVHSGQIQGMIVLVEPATFTDSDVSMLEVATHQIASQIHNLREYESVQEQLDRRMKQLVFIEDLSREITRILEIDSLTHYVLEAIIRATQADLGALILVERRRYDVTRRFLLDAEWHTEKKYETEVDFNVSDVIKRGKPQIVDNHPIVVELSGQETVYKSSASIPLVQGTRVIGVLEVLAKEPSHFHEEQLAFLSSLAGHTAISIQNARLLEERQHQIDTLVRLREISLNISGDTSRYTVIRDVLNAAMDIIPAEYIALYAFREDESIAQIYSLRQGNKPFSDPDILVPDHLLRDVADKGELLFIQNIAEDSAYQNYEHRRFIEYEGIIFAPIKRGNQVREIITLMFVDAQTDLTALRNPVELLLIQAASHLENNELYEQIRSGHNRMSAILDASNDGILLLDRHGRFLQGNVSAERILGVGLDEFVGQNFAEALIRRMDGEDFGSDDARNGLEKMARTLYLEPERITQQQYTLRRNSRNVIHIDEVGSPVLNAQNEIVGRLLVLRDITEQKSLDDYREEITNMVIHDLRGPLSSIISSLTLALEVVTDPVGVPIEAVLTPTMEVSLDSSQSLLRLVDSLLDIAKLEKAAMPIELEPMDVFEIAESAVQSLERLIDEAKLSVELHIPDDLPQAYADHDKIRRIMINLLDNAVRYSPAAGKVLVEAHYTPGESFLTVSVTDSGRGIPAAEREQVFEKFHQVKDSAPSRGRKGTGLGLTFCKLTVEAHGGTIRVESHPVLSGASFVFTLPIVNKGSH